MANNVRSEYLQRLIEDKNNLEEKMKEVTASTIKNIMGENIDKTIRNIISEAEDDSFKEDEVEDVVATTNSDDDDTSSEETTEITVDDENGGEDNTNVETEFEETSTEDSENIWNDLESLKGEDGEYDLTGMDKDGLIKVMQVMTPEDGVRVIKNDNGTVTLTDDSTQKEYIIDIECNGEDCDVKAETELTTEGKDNTGYGIHQKETAMDMPANPSDTTNKNQTHGLGTEPTGDSRRFGNGVGEGEPFNEETIVEVVEDAVEEGKQEGSGRSNTGKSLQRQGIRFGNVRNQSHDATTGKTGEAPYSNAQLEAIKRKANEIFRENKELKDVIIPELKRQIQENILINHGMGNVMKLIMNNATTINEKKDILDRFTKIKSKEESDSLYQTISEELKRSGKTLNVNSVMNSQISESKEHTVTEKPMYVAEELSSALDLIKRMNNL